VREKRQVKIAESAESRQCRKQQCNVREKRETEIPGIPAEMQNRGAVREMQRENPGKILHENSSQ